MSQQPMVAGPGWWLYAATAAERGDLAARDRAVAAAHELARRSAVVEGDLIETATAAAQPMAPHDARRVAEPIDYAASRLALCKPGL